MIPQPKISSESYIHTHILCNRYTMPVRDLSPEPEGKGNKFHIMAQGVCYNYYKAYMVMHPNTIATYF